MFGQAWNYKACSKLGCCTPVVNNTSASCNLTQKAVCNIGVSYKLLVNNTSESCNLTQAVACNTSESDMWVSDTHRLACSTVFPECNMWVLCNLNQPVVCNMTV